MIGLNHYLVLSALMFCIGLYGVIRRRNMLMLLFATEIALNAVNIAFVSIGRYVFDVHGQVFALFIISVAASEVAVGLGLVLMLHRKYKTLDIDVLCEMKG